jgi:hypothetical protein
MSEYADGFDDGKGEKFDELMEEITTLRQQLAKANAAYLSNRVGWEKECVDGDALCSALKVERTEGGSLNMPKMLAAIAALREQLAKAQSEYICTCGIRVTPHKCPTDNDF